MSTEESVTEWLANLKQGDSQAAQQLWQRYIGQLVRLARHRLGQTPRRAADEEDVAVRVFASFCQGVDAGRFPKLEDRDDLWQVLLMLTERKAIDQMRHELAEKRGGGDVRGDSVLAGQDQSETPGVARIVDGEPTPEFAAQVAENVENMLAALGDDQLRQIAVDKLEGYTNNEIAQRLGTSLRSIERRLRLIRRLWKQEREP